MEKIIGSQYVAREPFFSSQQPELDEISAFKDGGTPKIELARLVLDLWQEIAQSHQCVGDGSVEHRPLPYELKVIAANQWHHKRQN
jgi:hypothetical protein